MTVFKNISLKALIVKICLYIFVIEIIATAERTDIAPQVKDGYIMMFIYMPGVFNDDFIPYINQIITPILKVS